MKVQEYWDKFVELSVPKDLSSGQMQSIKAVFHSGFGAALREAVAIITKHDNYKDETEKAVHALLDELAATRANRFNIEADAEEDI
jgi:hypothetical protein